MLRCWLESNFLCASAWAREALIFGWLPVNSQRFGFKVHTDSGWRVRVSSKKLSGKKVGGCWSLIAGFGWRLWQFAKIWSQKILRDFGFEDDRNPNPFSDRRFAWWCLNPGSTVEKNEKGALDLLLGLSWQDWSLLLVSLPYQLTPGRRGETFFFEVHQVHLRYQVVPELFPTLPGKA